MTGRMGGVGRLLDVVGGVGRQRLAAGARNVLERRLVHPQVEPAQRRQRPHEPEEEDGHAVAHVDHLLLILAPPGAVDDVIGDVTGVRDEQSAVVVVRLFQQIKVN